MRTLREEIKEWRQGGFQRERELLVAQWLGYIKSPIESFDQLPALDVLNLAYGNPTPEGLSFDCLTRYLSEIEIKEVVQKLRSRNIKVILSLTDYQEYSWNKVNSNLLVEILDDLVREWGFDGFDFQTQSEVQTSSLLEGSLINIIKSLRQRLPEGRMITYTSHQSSSDLRIIKNTSKILDWVNIVPVDLNLNNLIKEYQIYSNTPLNHRINLGLKVQEDKSIELLSEALPWQPAPKWKFQKVQKMGIYLWGINKENNQFHLTQKIIKELPQKRIKYTSNI